MPHPSTTELAKVAYAAYGESTGHRTHDDRPMPSWDDLGDRVRLAWIAAASAVALHNIAQLTGINTPSTDPSVGDVVLVPTDPALTNGADVAPAVITRVWTPTCVNVRILADNDGIPRWRTSLTFVETLDHAAPEAGVWTWPGGED